MLRTHRMVVAMVFGFGMLGSSARAADDFEVDAVHSSVSFMISHLGLSNVHGRFNEFSGSFSIDKEDPAKSTFSLTIKTSSVDTNNKQRDAHLRQGDFFNSAQFPKLTFESTSVKAVEGGYEVTGDLTMHGVKKPVTLTMKGGKTAEFPKGKQRTGFVASVVIKRSEFGMTKALDLLGDEVSVSIGVEAVKK